MEQEKHIDFHSHTVYSDGSDTPENLIRAMHMSGVDIAAVTDHDTLASYPRAKKEAERYGFSIIPGVEITTTRYHILGLNVDVNNADLQNLLSLSRELQIEDCRRRIDKLTVHGAPITLNKLQETYPDARVGTWNITMTMLADAPCRDYLARMHGRVPTPREVHNFYLGKAGIGAKVKRDETIHSKEAIASIHEAGGIAIVAHPFNQVQDIEKELGRLCEKGLDGLEIQPNYGMQNEPFSTYALQHNLMMTYGSDFHGAGYTRQLLGRRENCLENQVLEEMLAKWKK